MANRMISDRISLTVAICLFLVTISEAGNSWTTKKSIATKQTNNVSPGARRKRSMLNEHGICRPYGRIFQNGGYCKSVLNNLPVYGKDLSELYVNERKLQLYQVAKDFLLKTRENSTNKPSVMLDSSFEVRQSCLKAVDDIYCHHYFKRCYLSSSPQILCREACQDLFFRLCNREFKLVSDFNKDRLYQTPEYPFFWDIINCTILPFQNESSNCYYPDKIREKLNVLESEGCFYGDGRGYRGNISTTISGYTCQSWDSQYPHVHKMFTGQSYNEIRNSSNYCRNPGGLSLNGPWCYTTNKTVEWELCDVPKCAQQPPSSPPSDFRGHNVSSTSVKTFWGEVPKPSIHGILLGFYLLCEKLNSSSRQFAKLEPEIRKWEFKGLEKFTNYSCRLMAFNNFGNGTWSKVLTVSTDEDAPSAPPEKLEAWNVSSTSLYVQWDPIPTNQRNGEVLGYNVEIRPDDQMQGGKTIEAINFTTSLSLTFNTLKKYCKYEVSVYGMTRRGKGPAQVLMVQTAEDVPDQPPTDVTAFSLGKYTVQVAWNPVPLEYTNGEVLGYKVFYNDVNDTARVNSTVVLPKKNRLKIQKLRPGTNYSVRVLAFTRKGDGVSSAKYYVRTLPDQTPKRITDKVPGSATSITGIVTAAVFSGIVAVGAVFFAIYFVRKRRRLANAPDGNNGLICPYAISPSGWIENIIANRDRYETLDNEIVPSRSRGKPQYVNISPDGSLNLPPYLRDIFFEFERCYENTHYKRLRRRRRSIGGALSTDGYPIYDQVERVVSPSKASYNSNFTNKDKKMTTIESSKEHKHNSIDLGELRTFMVASQGDVDCDEMKEVGAVEQETQRHRRRFSVDLGEVREFIALRDMKMYLEDDVRTREGVDEAGPSGTKSCSDKVM